MATVVVAHYRARGSFAQPASLPFALSALVVRGAGRGSAELDCPTANLAPDCRLAAALPSGVYAGFARIDDDDDDDDADDDALFPAVMSVGANVFYGAVEPTFEVHIMHEYGERAFYGRRLVGVITHYIRPMAQYSTREELVAAIDADKEYARRVLAAATH